MTLIAPILATLALWWISTGAVLVLGERSQGARRLAFVIMSLIAMGGLAGIWMLRDVSHPMAAYAGALSALAIWAWHEMSFLFGHIAGPNRQACPSGLSGWARFRAAAATLIHHELALAATIVALGAISWGADNAVGFQVFSLLFGLRLSAKLNLFFGAPYIATGFLPGRLAYLHSYFSPRPAGWFFLLSVGGIAALAAGLLWSAALTVSPYEATAYALLGALAALGALEHAFLALPVPDSALWRWLLPARDPRRAQDL